MQGRALRTAVAATVLTLPWLAGCGTSAASSSGTSTPPTAETSAEAPAPAAQAAGTPAASSGAALDRETEEVQAATQKFVRAVLTIGYPDRSFDAYTDRIRPLMTDDGFAALQSDDAIKKGSNALTTLYAQRSRSAPRFAEDAKVLALDSSHASAQLDYENVVQQKSDDGWKTLKSLGKGTATVKLVKDDGTWLVANAS